MLGRYTTRPGLFSQQRQYTIAGRACQGMAALRQGFFIRGARPGRRQREDERPRCVAERRSHCATAVMVVAPTNNAATVSSRMAPKGNGGWSGCQPNGRRGSAPCTKARPSLLVARWGRSARHGGRSGSRGFSVSVVPLMHRNSLCGSTYRRHLTLTDVCWHRRGHKALLYRWIIA
jgi:hypothetical protein